MEDIWRIHVKYTRDVWGILGYDEIDKDTRRSAFPKPSGVFLDSLH